MNSIKFVLCISRITYIPDNGLAFLDRLIELRGKSLIGVLILENRRAPILFRALVASCCGALHTAGALLRHACHADRRQSLLQAASIPILHASSANGLAAIQWMADRARAGASVGVNARTRCVFQAAALSAMPHGWYNIHHGVLPRWRGTSCDLRALVAGENPGFSLHRMTDAIDQGSIARTFSVAVEDRQDYAGYLQRVQMAEAELLDAWLSEWEKRGRCPTERPNWHDAPIWCRTPGALELLQMRWAKGIRL